MRTTLMLPDDLYRDVKRAAAEEERTVTSVVEEALREYLRRRLEARQRPREPFVVPTVSGGKPRPGIDWTSNAAIEEAAGFYEPEALRKAGVL